MHLVTITITNVSSYDNVSNSVVVQEVLKYLCNPEVRNTMKIFRKVIIEFEKRKVSEKRLRQELKKLINNRKSYVPIVLASVVAKGSKESCIDDYILIEE
jgi:hypothetical protein